MNNTTQSNTTNSCECYAVFGACGRIGQAVTRHLLELGHTVLAVDINQDGLQQLEASLNPTLKDNCHLFELNLFDTDQARKFFDKLSSDKRHVVGFCNSIISDKSWKRKRFEDLDHADLTTGILSEIPFQTVINRTICEYLVSIGGGSLVLISSIQGCFAPKFHHYNGTNMTSPIDYSVAKAATIISAQWMSKYYSGKNISINTVSPGGILDNQPPKFLESYRADCSNKGMLSPADIAPTIVHLLQPAARYITGQNVVIDDGWSL